MATFANQASNLSALGSKFDQLLKVPGPNDESEGTLRSTGANTVNRIVGEGTVSLTSP